MLTGFKAQNHPQQTGRHGPNRDVDSRATHPSVFTPLHDRFQFSIDVAAAAHNAKLPRYYDIEQDGLAQSWAGERVWCNPPYSNIEPWVAKAWEHAPRGAEPAELIVMLLPANRTEQGWWQRLVEPSLRSREPGFRVEFLSGRIRFIKDGQSDVGPNERPPFGCCLLIWDSAAAERSTAGGAR